ncbi:uncharacterized protein C11orf16 homolog [Terrapene carolina triunguis]|uniref:uncharacterized protein C11orf16 homolog n=1 Tax=Terrapene triunguis TaxID=2587831 RepID=UPI0011568D23|nr:uncharacterized protein C11orf16 homolog [Terrapene carolina triunguis]
MGVSFLWLLTETLMYVHASLSSTQSLPVGNESMATSLVTGNTSNKRLFTPNRCSWISHCPHFPDTAYKHMKVWEKSVNIAHVPVLARRESDGFYYLGTIKQEIEQGERGTFLVEFDKPPASGDKYSVCVQKTSRDDILEYVNGMRHSILPGDKVLAPWEPDLVRYGPGTILLGIETRDPLRASEDEEIMVYFWNDKKVKVPLGVALWIPPDTWERIVEMIHMPFTSRLKFMNSPTTTSSYTSTCRCLRAPIHSCALDDGLSKYRWPWPCPLICPPFHGHCHSICCSPVHVGCMCCSHPKFNAWWPLLSTSLLPQRSTKQQESNNKPTAQLLELESPKENEPAAATASASSSSSSSDLESEEETCLTKSTVVDSAVNTDSSLFKKPKLKDAARPEWKYWKRSHAKSHPRNPGISIPSSKCTKGKAESRTIFSLDMYPVAPTNQSAMFETIEQSPRRHLTLKDVLIHHDFKPSLGPQATPFLEKLGENQIERERQRKSCMEQKRKKKIQRQKWECEREQQAEEKYYTAQEHRRYITQVKNKKLQHFENEDKKVKEQDRKQNQTMKTKQLTQQRTNLKMQTMAEEDRQKGQQRLAHLQQVRETHDQREFNKCIAEEIKEKQSQEARRRRVETQYKLMAEKIFQDEKQKGK